MEVGTEISQKIRSAIKAKLMEIGSYVDDELPDYIMVMVANKKTQQQMSNDLSLFLGTNTDVFTTWLHGLLVKLQTVSGDSSKTEKSKSSKDKKREKNKSKDGVESKKEKRKISKKSGDGEDSDMPKVKSARTTNVEKSGIDALQTKDTVSENITNNRLSENEALEQNGTKSVGDSKQDHDIEDVRQLLVTETPSDELAEELEKSEEGIDLEKLASSSRSSAAKNASSSLKSKETVDAVEHERPSSQEPHTDVASSSKKRKCPSSVVAAVKRDDGIEDDHSTPMVASVVKVTSRKSSFPQSMQANSETLSFTEERETGESMKTSTVDERVGLDIVKKALSEVLTQWEDKDDDIRTFCKNIEKMLRKMSQGDLAISKLKIQKIFFDYEMSQHKQASSSKNCKTGSELIESPASSSGDAAKHTNKEILAASQLGRTENAVHPMASPSLICHSSPSTSQDNIAKARNVERLEKNIKNPGATSSQLNKTSEESVPNRIIFGPKQKEGESIQLSGSKLLLDTQDLSMSESSVFSNKNEVQSVTTAVSSTVIESSGFDSPSSSHCSSSVQVKWSSSSPSNSKISPAIDQKGKSSGIHPTTLVSSLHQKRRLGPDSPSVLRHSLSHDAAGSKTIQPQSSEGVPDSSKEITPEQLKVLAKNLKITVMNKRALKPEDKSNSDDSSSEDSDDESDSEEEDTDDEALGGDSDINKGNEPSENENRS